MPTTYQITLPVPPSINRMYRVFRGRVFMVREGKQYKETIERLVKQKYGDSIEPLAGPVSVSFVVYRASKRGDLDNFLKVMLDGLQGTVYKNDRQISQLHGFRRDDKQNPRVEVTVNAIQ